MGYMHIENLYKNQTILLFRECYALEKIHGTSAHITYKYRKVTLSPGGESAQRFAKLFDLDALADAFEAIGHPEVTVYGEAYGGSQQKQAWRYGPELKFVAFDVLVGEHWLTVPSAFQLVRDLGLEFVSYMLVSTDLAVLDAERDAPSTQAVRNGVEGDQPREGVVLRPPVEVRLNHGGRVMAKHKRAEERETASPRQVVDPSKLAVLQEAEQIADEWVTPTRLQHVLDKIARPHDMTRVREVISAMIEDVLREGAGELVVSREATKAIGTRAAKLYRVYLQRGEKYDDR